MSFLAKFAIHSFWSVHFHFIHNNIDHSIMEFIAFEAEDPQLYAVIVIIFMSMIKSNSDNS